MTALNKQALREAAEKALPAMKRLLMMPNDELFDEAQLNVDGDVDAANTFNLIAGPETMLALLDDLEAAERERDNWRNSFDNERFRADKLAEAFKTEHEQLVMANRALITQHVRANGAEKRIAELEARAVTLPADRDAESEVSGYDGTEFYRAGWNARGKADREALTAAGIGVKGD
ncbi:ead/Ea22-like family protein [Citrobacter meridianamericanus]|uniref:ead/Ea22-like family protein n=1 Tax=Citrobacter meridianamericanus TaxID=2894201 RepID=UPI0039BECB91